MKTLNTQYQSIKEGKGHKGVFLKEAKQQFPQWIRNAATYKETTQILKNKGIINENVIGLEPINQLVSPPKESYEVAFENYLEEAKKKKETGVKAEEKETSKSVKDNQDKNFDRKNMDDPNNLIFDQVMKGYYTEMKNPKNCKKTMEELKKIVFKNLTKNPIYYTEKGQFGEDGIGYETELPGLGTPKEPKGPYKSSGYGTLKEGIGGEDFNKDNNILYTNRVMDAIVDKSPTNTLSNEVRAELLRAINQMDTYTLDFTPLQQDYSPELLSTLKSIMRQVDQEFYQNDITENKLRKVINNLIREELDNPYSKHSTKAYGGTEDKDYTRPGTIYNVRDKDGNSIKNKDGKATWKQEPLDKHGERNHQYSKDVEDWVEDIAGISKADAIKYLGSQGLNASEVMKVLDARDFDLRGDDSQDPDVKIDTPWDIHETKLRKAINTLVKQQIKENVQKELLQINKDAEYEVLASKVERINAAIEKRQSQLDRLDEDEDLKNLTDKKKLKALGKDIKFLEKAKTKMEKLLAKKAKSSEPTETTETTGIIDEDGVDEAIDPKKLEDTTTGLGDIEDKVDSITKKSEEMFENDDVTDEDADEYFAQQDRDAENRINKGETSTNNSDNTSDEPSEEYLEAKEEAESRYEEGEEIESIIKDYPEFKEMLFHDLKGKFEGSDN